VKLPQDHSTIEVPISSLGNPLTEAHDFAARAKLRQLKARVEPGQGEGWPTLFVQGHEAMLQTFLRRVLGKHDADVEEYACNDELINPRPTPPREER
jgi:hypothetical protein